jgi:hypothetical protein
MPRTYDYSDSAAPLDVCLLLRSHAEQLWLTRETIPVLHQLHRRDELPEEQLGAALAYLEVSWLEASRLAAETEAARAALRAALPGPDRALALQACRYHTAVRVLREAVADCVRALVCAPADGTCARERARF